MIKKQRITTAQLAVMLAVMTAASKVLGIVRELFLANYYGAGYVTDAYTMSMSIPNNLLAGIVTAVATAYMPVYSQKVENKGEEEGNLFTSSVINILLLATIAVMILGWIFAAPLVKLFAPGFGDQAFELTVYYIRIAFVMVVFSVIPNILGSYLEYKGVFISQQFLAYIQNLSIITCIIVSAKLNMPKLLIYGITAGYLISAILKLALASRQGYKHKLSIEISDSVKEILTLAIPVFIGSSAAEINSLVDRILASNLEEGSVSALNYGLLFSGTLSAVTIGIFVMIIYPRITQAFAQNDYLRISDISERGINLIALIMVPCTLGALVYAEPVVQVVYERGAFDEAATALTAGAFFCYAIGMAFGALRTFLDKIFFSVHDTKTPVKCSLLSVALNIVLNIILVRFMAHKGLALATSISQIVSALAEYMLFSKKNPQIVLLRSKKKLAKICMFSALSVGISFLFYHFVGNSIWMPRMVLLGLTVLIAGLIYLALLYVNKFEELSLVRDLFGKKE